MQWRWHSLIALLFCFLAAPSYAADPEHGASCSGFTAGTSACNTNGCFVCTSGNWVDQPLYIGTSGATCGSTYEGLQRYNSTSKVMETCNGTAWLGNGLAQQSTNMATCNTANKGIARYHPATGNTAPVVAGYSKTSGTTASVTITKPASGVAAGDVLLLIISTDNWASFTLPSGFIDIGPGAQQTTNGADGQTMEIAYKIAGSSEPANYTITITGGSLDSAETMLHITGANPTNPIDTYWYATTPTPLAVPPPLPVTVPSITPGTNYDLILWIASGDAGGSTGNYTYTDPSGMTQVGTTNNSGVGSSIEVASLSQTTAAATGSLAGTVSLTSTYVSSIAFSVAIRSLATVDAIEVCDGTNWMTLAKPY